jgi:hypothetical protein
MQAANVHGHSLHQERGAFPDGLVPSRGQLIEERLMTIDGTRRASGPELLLEESGLSQGDYPNLAPRQAKTTSEGSTA